MAGIQVANLAGMFRQGQQDSQEDRKRGALSKFLQPAMQGDQGAISSLYGAGAGQEAMAAEQQGRQQQGDARKAFGDASVMLTQSGQGPMAQQMYSQWRQRGIAAGVLPPTVPEQFDPGALQVASAAAQAYGGQGADNTPAAIRELQMLQQDPALAKLDMDRRTASFGRPKLIPTADGYAWATPDGASPLNYGNGGVQFTIDDPQNMPPQVVDGIARSETTAGNRPWTANTPNPYRDATPRPSGQRVMPAPKATASFVPLNSDEIKAMGLPAGSVAQRNMQTGQVSVISKPSAAASKPPTEGERKAAGFLQRMEASGLELDALRAAGYKPEDSVKDFYTAGEGVALNWMASDEGQQNRQQQEDWVRAKLRLESGAVIADEEMSREIKTYFPQPGDSQTVIESKARSRERAKEQMKIQAGRAIDGNKPANGIEPGHVEDGFRFIGGDAADPNSWEQI